MDTTTVTAIFSGIASVIVAATALISTIINARGIKNVKDAVDTGNGTLIGALVQSDNARRIDRTIAPKDQTDDEKVQVADQVAKEAAKQAEPRKES